MEYIDSGSRDPSQALGAWLDRVLLQNSGLIAAVRWQTGFFSQDALGYFAEVFDQLRHTNGIVRVLVGSNQGATRRADLELLLNLVGEPREGLDVAVVSYSEGFFHPKTVHVTRLDGSAAAYVGSANLTGSGVSSLHVEAGVMLDSSLGDDSEVLHAIAAAIDGWFGEGRDGLYVIEEGRDLAGLEEMGVIGQPIPQPPSGHSGNRRGEPGSTPPGLRPLIGLPPVPNREEGAGTSTSGDAVELQELRSRVQPQPEASSPIDEWGKQLSRSDAQRKGSGHQRGSITLVRGFRDDIDAQLFFKHTFFGDAEWKTEHTRTGEVREEAQVVFAVEIDGQDLGLHELMVSDAPNREAGQSNYTSLLHLGSLGHTFAAQDFTDRDLHISKMSDGTFRLRIV